MACVGIQRALAVGTMVAVGQAENKAAVVRVGVLAVVKETVGRAVWETVAVAVAAVAMREAEVEAMVAAVWEAVVRVAEVQGAVVTA